jgi:8-oxo-dGTP pyrophosphatase MutT (NUDIX family)
MMCGVIAIIAFVVAAVVHGQEPTSDAHHFMNQLADNMSERKFKAPPLHVSDLDRTTLAKSQVGTKHSRITHATVPNIFHSQSLATQPVFPVAHSAYPLARHLPISHAFEEHSVRQAGVKVTASALSPVEVTTSALSPGATAAAVVARTKTAVAVEEAKKRSAAKPKIPEVPRGAVAVTTCRTKGTWEHGPWEYLLIKRSTPPAAGTWSIVSGKVELGENMLQAAARELGEETGLTAIDGVRINPWSVGTSETIYPYGTKFHYVIPLMFAFATNPDAVVHAGDDAVDFRWFTLDELEEGLLEINEREKTVAFLQRMEAWLAKGVLRPDDALAVETTQQATIH